MNVCMCVRATELGSMVDGFSGPVLCIAFLCVVTKVLCISRSRYRICIKSPIHSIIFKSIILCLQSFFPVFDTVAAVAVAVVVDSGLTVVWKP